LELFLEREVALRGGPNQGLIIFPSKFNRKLPDMPHPPLREVAYRFAGPVEDIYATLAVRLFYSDAFRLKDLWKNAAEFSDARGRLCGFELTEADGGAGTGKIYTFFDKATSIDSKVLLLRFINEHLNEKCLTGSVVRERIYRCANCGEEARDRRAIEVRLAKGLQKVPCLYCDETIDLADDLEVEFQDPRLGQRVREIEEDVATGRSKAVGLTIASAKAAEGEFDVFLAHNSADKHQVEMIGGLLRDRGLNPWLDKWNLPPGRRFAEEIELLLPQTKSVAVFVGKDGTGPWHKMEMYAALELFAQHKRPLIPVLLPGAPREPALPLFIRQIGWVRFVGNTTDREAIDNLVWGITGEHPRTKGG
jgi:TIR domain